MAVVDLRVCAIGVCAALVAGCGGMGMMSSSGGGGSNSTMVTVTFTGTVMPAVVAAKIGTGAFAAETLSSGMLTLSIPSGTNNYAVAAQCPAQAPQPGSQTEIVWEASIADGTSQTYSCPSGLNQTGTLTGSLNASAIPGVQSFWIDSQYAGHATSVGVTSGATASFNLPAASGNDRVLVLAFGSQGPAAAKNFDNQMVPGALNGGNTVVFGAADETTPQTITYNSVPSGFSSPSTLVTLAMGGNANSVPYAERATTQYPALPASATEMGDVYYFTANSSANGTNSSEVEAGTTSSGGPVSLTFPAPWSYAGPMPAALPTFTFAYSGFSGNANALQNIGMVWQSGSGAGFPANYFISVEATANYQAGSTTLAVPDLSGVAGFPTPPASGTQVEWTASIFQQSYSFTSTTPLNATWSSVSNGGSYMVP